MNYSYLVNLINKPLSPRTNYLCVLLLSTAIELSLLNSVNAVTIITSKHPWIVAFALTISLVVYLICVVTDLSSNNFKAKSAEIENKRKRHGETKEESLISEQAVRLAEQHYRRNRPLYRTLVVGHIGVATTSTMIALITIV